MSLDSHPGQVIVRCPLPILGGPNGKPGLSSLRGTISGDHMGSRTPTPTSSHCNEGPSASPPWTCQRRTSGVPGLSPLLSFNKATPNNGCRGHMGSSDEAPPSRQADGYHREGLTPTLPSGYEECFLNTLHPFPQDVNGGQEKKLDLHLCLVVIRWCPTFHPGSEKSC